MVEEPCDFILLNKGITMLIIVEAFLKIMLGVYSKISTKLAKSESK